MAELTYVRTPDFIPKIFGGYSELKISERIERLMFFYFSCIMASGAFLWGVLSLYLGYDAAATIPFFYIILTFLTFLLCSNKRSYRTGAVIQVFASIALPFLFQFALGGIINSGFVMLWAVLALLGSMTFQANKEIISWAAVFVLLCLHAFYLEATVFIKISRSLPLFITFLNLVLVSAIIFGLCHYFVRMQEQLHGSYSLKKKDLQVARESIDNDLSMAREYLDLLHSNGHVSNIFSDVLSFSVSKDHVNGNFYWQGDFIHNHVVVYVESPHRGIRGSLEAMMLWNMIENSVSKSEVQAPHNLIEFIQRDLYSKYDVPQVRESMTKIKMTVLCYDDLANEIQYASLGSTLLINEGDDTKVLCGFNTDKGECVLAPNGAKINIGRLKPQKAAKVLFVNDALLETLDIKDDQCLASSQSKLSSIFNWNFRIAKKELQKAVSKADSEKDLFLLGLQF